MDPTTAAGIAVLIAKLGAFALIIRASRRATRAVRDMEAAKAARAAETAAAVAAGTAAVTAAPVAAGTAAPPLRVPEPV